MAPGRPLKRSTINRSIEIAIQVFGERQIQVPPFAFWSIEEWGRKGPEADEIRDCMLGWDVTDFGSGDFETIGRTLFTLRNGRAGDDRYPKTYAEKLILDPEGQRAPAHYHRSKREDIVNRGGGNILVQLRKADENGQPTDETFDVQVDGQTVRHPGGGKIRLTPGMSLCIPPRTVHQFWGEEGTGYRIDGVGYTISGEVSSVCDDWNDNAFLTDYAVRFPEIDEDEPRRRYLCHEYPRAGESRP